MSAGWMFALAVSSLAFGAALQDPAPAPEPFAGTLLEGREKLQALTEAAEHEAASALANSVLAKPDWPLAPERERAEFHFAQAVAYGAALNYPEAAQAAHAARGLSGSSELGLASAYNAGTFRLLRAEELRREVPEIREKLKLPPAAPPATGAPQNAPPGTETASDPIASARSAYLAARADLLERWRAEPAHLDTRANLELVVRRLRELDEIERQREEQQSEPNERDDQDQKQDPEQQQGDQSQDPQNQDQQDEQKDPEQKPQDQPKDPKEQESKEPSKPEEGEQDAPKDEPKPQDGADPAQPPDERLLTPEEVQRLLQQLEKIEDQAAQVQAALRRARRVPVKRDW